MSYGSRNAKGRPITKSKAKPRPAPSPFMVGDREFYPGCVLLIQRKAEYGANGEGAAEAWIDATIDDVSGKKPKFGTYRIVSGGECDEIVTFTIAPDPEPPVPVIVKFDEKPNGTQEEDDAETDDEEEDDDY